VVCGLTSGFLIYTWNSSGNQRGFCSQTPLASYRFDFTLGMVNFKDPVVISRDASMYSVSGAWNAMNDLSCCSGRREALAYRGWSVHVRLVYPSRHLFGLNLYLPAGSSSLTSIMSGVSSEGVAPTDGRYGSVTTGTSSGLCGRLIFVLQLYSFTRVTTLLAMITNMIGFDTSRPINCQVSPVFVFVYHALTL